MNVTSAGLADTVERLTGHPALDRLADPVSQAVHGFFRLMGADGRRAKNALHGTWLGHPLHPVFTDVPLGAWTTALVLHVAGRGHRGMRRAATLAMGVGLAGAVGAAATGLTDWSDTDGAPRRVGLVHGLTNLAATLLFATAFVRRRKVGSGGLTAASIGYALAVGAAYLGGDLVYRRRIGSTHAVGERPQAFTPVMESAALPDETMACARAGTMDVLLARQPGGVCALVHACSHLGGPLSEGELKEGAVVCPWHGSEFALSDGRVLNGPATAAQPRLVARERDGRIEVKAPAATSEGDV